MKQYIHKSLEHSVIKHYSDQKMAKYTTVMGILMRLQDCLANNKLIESNTPLI